MKQQLLDNLYYIVASSTSIKAHVDKIAELRQQLDDTGELTDIDRIEINNIIKSRVQDEANLAINNARGHHPAILMATGTGKTKVVIDRIQLDGRRRLIVVPTIVARDVTWKAEFYKWNRQVEWTKTEIICYDSLASIPIGTDEYDEVYLDEGHNLTPANAVFFKNVKVRKIILLTATKPENQTKIDLLRSLAIYPSYTITLDEAVKLGLIAPYDIVIITVPLDNTDKYIKAGNQKISWMTTEVLQYNYITSKIKDEERANKMDKLVRMRFLYNCKTKLNAAAWILENIIPKKARTIIFAGSIDHARKLCPHRYHSKPTATKKDSPQRTAQIREILVDYAAAEHFDWFQRELINRMSCVEALNENANLTNIDYGFIAQLNASKLDFIQRIGRTLRFRPDHVGKLIILAVEGTVDMDWVRRATSGLNATKIRQYKLADLQAGTQTISFD